jgi:protein O-GlcNAc transferase
MSVAAGKAFADAVAVFRARKFADAERLCRTVLESRPQHVGALNLLTMTLMSVARFAEAATCVSRALWLDPRFDLSFRNFGIILGKLGKPKQALEQFDRALALNPTFDLDQPRSGLRRYGAIRSRPVGFRPGDFVGA